MHHKNPAHAPAEMAAAMSTAPTNGQLKEVFSMSRALPMRGTRVKKNEQEQFLVRDAILYQQGKSPPVVCDLR
jgi:hypothetical protein